MKTGGTLQDIAIELRRRDTLKKDFIADSKALRYLVKGNEAVLDMPSGHMSMNRHALQQLTEKLKIPFQFYERLLGNYPEVARTMVSEMLVKEPQKLMIRTLEDKVRAIFSTSYRPLDNFDLAQVVLPILTEYKAEVSSINLSDERFYIKACVPSLVAELPVPQGLKMGQGHNWFTRRVRAGICISNSEIGMGAITVQPAILEEQCTNFAIFENQSFRKIHVGQKQFISDVAIKDYLSDRTKTLQDTAVWAMIRDLTTAALDSRIFNNIVESLNQARSNTFDNPSEAITQVTERFLLTTDESKGLLNYLIEGGEMSQYGLQYALTRLAGTTQDYERATVLERAGGEIIELKAKDWSREYKNSI